MRNFQTNTSRVFNLLFLGWMILVLLIVLSWIQVYVAKATPDENEHTIFLPLVFDLGKEGPVLLGIYPRSYWQPTLEDALENEFLPVDTWSGKKVSLAGVFHSFGQFNTVTYMLSTIWDQGYTPFVNIYSNQSIQNIASGSIDDQIRAWAQSYRSFSNNGNRMAYLAPLQEMNGNWTPYGSSDPEYFKRAFQRVVTIFAEEGVPASSVQWVFAPNGKSSTGWPSFEAYYPGDSFVNVVGFSSYNYGFHPNVYPESFRKWESPEKLFTEYVNRMRIMAPSKPVFIAQTGTTAYGPDGYDVEVKNQWLEDAYNLVSTLEGVRGILYYNDVNKFDWAFYYSNSNFYGYQEGVLSDLYQYIPPGELANMTLSP